jgi:carboxyl-terminal processing protease
MNSRFKFLTVLSSALLVILLLIGSVIGQSAAPDQPYRQLNVYTEVLSRIKSEYVEEPDMKTVTLGAMNGLLESLDPFASYLNAEQYQEYIKSTHKGETGLLLSKKFGYLGVVNTAPGSPAAKAGLATGDVLETIKGISTRDMPLAYANLLLNGQPGTTIEIGAVRVRRSTEPQKILLTRAAPSYPSVESKMLPEAIGYVRPQTLVAAKLKETASAVESLQKQGAKRLILDLRNTAVGSPAEGVALANLFIPRGMLTYLEGQRTTRQNFEADPAKTISKLPLVVLTNRGTADGAEVASAALLELKRAELVGEKTYGDAALRRAITMEDGSAVILSVAKYYSPSGKAIQDNGVTPGTLILEQEAQLEVDENGDPLPQAEPEKKSTEDPALKKAIEVVKTRNS